MVPDEMDMTGLCEGCECRGGNGSGRVGDGNYPRRRGWRVKSRDAWGSDVEAEVWL